jgi:hypothetical protein
MDLFQFADSRPMHGRGDHQTSVEAAAKVALKISPKRLAVLAFAQQHGPFIDSQLKAHWPDAPESTYRKRRSELAAVGLLEATGGKVPNDKGSNEIVWRITRAGQRALEEMTNA